MVRDSPSLPVPGYPSRTEYDGPNVDPEWTRLESFTDERDEHTDTVRLGLLGAGRLGDNTPSAAEPKRPGDQSPLWRPWAAGRTVLTNPRKGDRDDSEDKVHTEGQPSAAAG